MNRQAGYTLIEVLVALFVLGVGILGLLALHTEAQLSAIETYQRSHALVILDDMVNRMYASPVEAKSCYVTSRLAKLPGQWEDSYDAFKGCSIASDRDLAEWNQMLRGAGELITADGMSETTGAMIGAVGCIVQDGTDTSLFLVSVAWQGMKDTVAPVDTCGLDIYDSEQKRRVISAPVRLTLWK